MEKNDSVKSTTDKTTSYENSPLNPITNKSYVDEIKKSLRMLEAYEEDSLFKKLMSAG